MYYYLKKGLAGVKVFDFELDTVNYGIGSTYEDYLSGAWIPLNDTHLDFIHKNAKATEWEIINLELDVVQPPIELSIEERYNIEVAKGINEVYSIDEQLAILFDKDMVCFGSTKGSDTCPGTFKHYSIYEELSDAQILDLYNNGGIPF